MSRLIIEVLRGENMADAVVKQCADLFSHHYAFWGPQAEKESGGKLIKGNFISRNTNYS
jgi:hypothetical protein